MGKWIIYHNPKCSKSRQALSILQDNGIEPEVVEYLKETPSLDTLIELKGHLSLRPRDFIRTKEEAFKTLDLDLNDDDALLEAMALHPKLLERPIVVRGNEAVVARPPEKALDLKK